MGDNRTPNSAGPSERERIKALHDHAGLFEKIAEFPEAGVHERFLREWALVNAYVESKVFRCQRSFESFVKGTAESEAPILGETELEKFMDPLVESLLLHARVIKGSQRMVRSPLPSVPFMDLYRAWSGVEEPGMRAANGEMASRYDQKRQPVPPNLGVVDHEDLEPMTQFVWKWIADPVNEWFVAPSTKLLHSLPMYKDEESHQEDKGFIDERSIQVLANGLMYVLVMLILVAPIATFNVVESQTTRIVVMPLYCLLLVALAQYMGSKSRFIASLATAYFQAMVIYVGTTSDRQASR